MQPNDASLDAVRATDTLRDMTRKLDILCAATVEAVVVRWLLYGWLPFGKLVEIIGVAGVGKTMVVLDMIARATRGGPLPPDNDGPRCEPVTVLIAGCEDGMADTIRPRLDAADADLSRVHFVTAIDGHTFTIPRDVRELMEKAVALGVKWLHIDAIYGVLDEHTNAYSDHEIRRALAPLKDAAEQHGILVTFIRHPRKSAASAVNAGGGSMAFTALARVSLFAGFDPHDQTENQNDRRRILAVGKSNLAAHPPAFAFHVRSHPGARAGHIAWDGTATVSADELAAPALPTPKTDRIERPDPRANEKAWLIVQLPEGSRVPKNDLIAAARRDGFEWHRVKRAASDVGVCHERTDTFPSTTVWFLPAVQSEQSEQSAHPISHIGDDAPSVPTAHSEHSEHPTLRVKNGAPTALSAPTVGEPELFALSDDSDLSAAA